MNYTKEQIEAALAAGMAITSPESDTNFVPMKHAAGCLILRQLINDIGSGKIALAPTQQPVADPIPKNIGPTAKRKASKKK